MTYHEAMIELRELLDPINYRIHHALVEELDNLPNGGLARMRELFEVIAERSNDDSIMQFVFDYPEQIGALFDE